MPITISKEHEGKTVYGLGWGNNCPRSGQLLPVEFYVAKVNRKYVSLQSKHGKPENYDPESGTTQSEINRGYLNEGYAFFESLQDIKDHIALTKIKGEISGYFRNNPKLSEGQARTIRAILFPNQTAE